jgi:hypothetical protein
MRGWVCRLQLLLAFANAIILRSEPRGNPDHILLSHIRDPPTWRAGGLAKTKSSLSVMVDIQHRGGSTENTFHSRIRGIVYIAQQRVVSQEANSARTCLPGHCLTMDVSDSTIKSFGPHVTVFSIISLSRCAIYLFSPL